MSKLESTLFFFICFLNFCLARELQRAVAPESEETNPDDLQIRELLLRNGQQNEESLRIPLAGHLFALPKRHRNDSRASHNIRQYFTLPAAVRVTNIPPESDCFVPIENPLVRKFKTGGESPTSYHGQCVTEKGKRYCKVKGYLFMNHPDCRRSSQTVSIKD